MMHLNQHTINKTCTFEGVSLHTGVFTKIKLHPAPANTGIKFKRLDSSLPSDQILIEANIENVKASQLCTTIENKYGLQVSTIEHLMSALHAVGIDNLLIDIDGNEMPILDGSSFYYSEKISEIGLMELKAQKKYLKILKEISVERENAFIKILPNQNLSIDYTIDYPGTIVGNQNILIKNIDEDSFRKNLADCRTFTFASELDDLRTNGIIKGGSLDNAVVFGKNNLLNQEGLKFDNEPARHKALDAIGDLYLCGYSLLGHVVAYCAGHSLMHELVRKIFSDNDNWELVSGNEFSSYSSQPIIDSINSLNL